MKYKRVGPFISVEDANKQLFNDDIRYCLRVYIPEILSIDMIKVNSINLSYRGLTIHGKHTYVTNNDSYRYWHPVAIGITDKTFNNHIFLKE